MTTATATALTKRELMLILPEVGETINAFGYAYKLALSLKEDKITSEQYEMLAGDLEAHCKQNNIATKNEVCNLF